MLGDMIERGKNESKKDENVSYISSRLALISMLWFIMLTAQIVNYMTGNYLTNSVWFSIEPRNWRSLPMGLLASAFLHANWNHFWSNTISFWILGFLTLTQRYKFDNAAKTFAYVSLTILILGGACIWVLGRSGHHIGASGWIFGLMGYNLAFGIYNTCILREPKWMGLFISLIMVCFYLTTILKALNPFNVFSPEVSGEGHLSCLLVGVLIGCYETAVANKKKKDKRSFQSFDDVDYLDEITASNVEDYSGNLTQLI